mmetsp:Transcript_40445/g.81559  ORF Transcript_40445/g.81559 Transcript_40445/m.81559 type:complete len:208 (+) Transcript_40445:190-813(+)
MMMLLAIFFECARRRQRPGEAHLRHSTDPVLLAHLPESLGVLRLLQPLREFEAVLTLQVRAHLILRHPFRSQSCSLRRVRHVVLDPLLAANAYLGLPHLLLPRHRPGDVGREKPEGQGEAARGRDHLDEAAAAEVLLLRRPPAKPPACWPAPARPHGGLCHESGPRGRRRPRKSEPEQDGAERAMPKREAPRAAPCTNHHGADTGGS